MLNFSGGPMDGQSYLPPDGASAGPAPGGAPGGEDPMAALMGGMGAGAAADPMASEQPTSEWPDQPEDILRKLFEGVKRYLEVEPDDEDTAKGTKILANVQDLLAKQQKQAEAATGVSPAAKYLSREKSLGRA